MPKLVPNVSVVIHRGEERIVCEPGVAFDFKDSEVKAIRAQNKYFLRDPVNESVDLDTGELLDENTEVAQKTKPLTAKEKKELAAKEAADLETQRLKDEENAGGGDSEDL